ncbi:saccharopine dehydrogenase NADP-binding domain-containing protein [Solwaraspora sp. WMMD1047]|uniref:saccharopine dehydrogenase family protein n=1 Tax=Solwaraspora sp. WMMD1047 TaxID=3016102 RepID=UPI00241692F6|nr:saccharopine dehydrogenase NADP-binding domain-containing protein [Solwaraspora sp. WMMD1047]MDG4830152.1 saccharopine dehydrogenase NADP-binding domain-containing protein [Solwaraspora sp. WMMD1047]
MTRIVVLGGYGAVGRAVARTLAPTLPGRIVVAGRDPRRADAFVAQHPDALVARRVDARDPGDVAAVLTGARVLVMCLESGNEQVARRCLERGVHYVDVSASLGVLSAIGRLDPLAVRNGVTAALSVGLAPGLTNLLARHVTDRLADAEAVDLTVLIGTGERHGPGAVDWLLDNLAASVPEAGGPGPLRVGLPGYGRRTTHPFPFSDQYTLRRTLGVPVTTRLCFDSAALTAAVFALRRGPALRLLRRPGVAGAVSAAMARLRLGSDGFAVRATARAADGRLAAYALTGRGEARVTGVVAALVARHLHGGGAPAGVRHLDQFLDPAAFFAQLGEYGVGQHELPAGTDHRRNPMSGSG